MPVSSHHVPLDTAKAWAKRLARFTRDSASPSMKLHQAQAAVADMLGFDDWHALTQRLNTAPELLPPKMLATNPIPKTRDELTAFWDKMLATNDATDIHFEKRSDKLRVRVRQDGEFHHEWETTSTEPFETLLSLADVELETGQEDFFGTEYTFGTWIPLSKNLRYCLRYQSLPVYPSGRDVVVRRDALRAYPIASEWFPEHQQLLKDCLYPGPGLVVVAGTTGSGRTTFVHHLMKMARQNHTKQNPKTLIFSDSPCQAFSPLEATVIYKTSSEDSLSSVSSCVEKGLDFFLIDDFRTPEQMRLARSAIQRGTLVFITFNASSARGTLNRLLDFTEQTTQPEALAKELCLRLSTYVKLLPRACQQCSMVGAAHQERNAGCEGCHGRGKKGRVLQTQAAKWEKNQFHDLWPKWEQVQKLLAENQVGQRDVEESLGPEPLEHAATEEQRFWENTPFAHDGQI